MTSQNISDLSRCAFFEEFLPKHREKLMQLGSQVHFEKDEIIFRQDDESTLFYVIVSGRVVLEARVDGHTVPIQTLYANDELGWSAVLNRRRQFQARALEPVEAMSFEIPKLREACLGNPYFGCAFLERMFTLVAERLESTRLQLVAAHAETPGKPSGA